MLAAKTGNKARALYSEQFEVQKRPSRTLADHIPEAVQHRRARSEEKCAKVRKLNQARRVTRSSMKGR